jgi:methylenetetrahydrofolate reductase (NADPH)
MNLSCLVSRKITDILKEKPFTLSVELVPPRNGTNIQETYDCIQKLSGKVDFVSVTKGAGGSLRGGTLPITYFSKDKFGLDTIAHFVCRERTKQEIENELTDLHYFGIKNILALRGDPPAGAKDEEWKGDYKYAYLLAGQINQMNNGKFLPTPTMKVDVRDGLPTDFCIIVAGHPEDPIEDEVEHLRHKINAGAEVIITQMIFSFEEYKIYVENLRRFGINLPVLAGVRPLVQYSQADSAQRFFGLKVADELIDGLKEREDKEEAWKFGINYTVDMLQKLKGYGCPGVHLFVLNDTKLIDDLLPRITSPSSAP